MGALTQTTHTLSHIPRKERGCEPASSLHHESSTPHAPLHGARCKNIFLDIFEGVQTCELSLDQIEKGIDIVKSLSEISGFLSSNSEARRALKENSISVNKNKVSETYTLTTGDLIRNKYIIINRGKKKTFIFKIK